MQDHRFPAFAGDEFDGPVPLTPEQNLLREIVVRAILDYIGPAQTPTHVKRSARLFFHSKRTDPFSFVWISQHLSSDPDGYREKLLRNMQTMTKLGLSLKG